MTPHPDLAVVTGAFSYTGKYVARRLLDQGVRVRTLSRSPDAEDPLAGHVEAAPLAFSDPDGLRRSMEGAGVFYNAYWIRYAHGRVTFNLAVENTGTLLEAAKSAGVGRVVHFSVTNPSPESRLPYFRGKGRVEEILRDMGIPYAIIRPTLVFGEGDLLLNNMAWALRRFPVFPVFGNGDYKVQPIHAEDLANQAVAAGSRNDSFVADAAGPDTFTFEGLLRLLAKAVNARVRLVHTPPSLGFALTRLVGLMLRDVVLTRDEVDGLMAGLLTSHAAPAGTARLAGRKRGPPGTAVRVRIAAQPPALVAGCETISNNTFPKSPAVQRRWDPVSAPHRNRAGHRPGQRSLQGGGQHRQRPGGGPEVPPPQRRLADHQQRQGAARRRHPAVGSQLLSHPLGTDGGSLELDVVGSSSQGAVAHLHQQVGPHLGQAGDVHLSPPAGRDLHSFPGEAHHQPVHPVVVALLVFPVPAVQVGPVAAADHRRQHPAHVGRPPHPQLRQVVPPVEDRHEAGLDEPSQVAADLAG